MKKLMCNSKLYKLRLLNNMPLIFGGPTYSEEWSAPCNTIIEDYQQKMVFEFIHPKDNCKQYTRHYERPAYHGFAVLKVGLFRNAGDYARVIINIASANYEPYVVLEDYMPAFSSAEMLVEIVTRAFNWALKSNMLSVVMEPWEPNENESVNWIRDCYETFWICRKECENDELMNFGFEQLKKSGGKRKTGDFISYIKPGNENGVMSWLHKEIDDTKDIAVFMRPMRAINRLGLFDDRPPMNCFCDEFHKEGLIKISAYNNYMNTDNDKCCKDRAYYQVLKRASDYFGIIV